MNAISNALPCLPLLSTLLPPLTQSLNLAGLHPELTQKEQPKPNPIPS